MVEGKKAAGGEDGCVLSLRQIFRRRREELQREDDEPGGGQNERQRSRRGETGLLRLREDFLPPVRRQLAEGETFQIMLKGIGGRFHGVNSS